MNKPACPWIGAAVGAAVGYLYRRNVAGAVIGAGAGFAAGHLVARIRASRATTGTAQHNGDQA